MKVLKVRRCAHGTFQGMMSGLQGGNFWSGFASGALASIAASAWSADFNGSSKAGSGWAGSVRDSGAGMIAFGTVAGGAGAALTGGNFWQGAVTGLVVSGLNHGFHNGDGPDDPQTQDEKAQAEGWTNSELKQLYELNKFAIEAYGFVRGAAELSAVKWGALATSVKALFSSETKILVQFGKGENQVYHAFRHTEEMGLSTSAVKSAILKDITRISKNVTYGGKTIYTQIKVGGQDIIYSAHRLENGSINVGRINGL